MKTTHSANLTINKAPIPGKRNHQMINPRVTNAAKILVNGYEALALFDPCTQNGDLISNRFCQLYNIPTKDMEKKLLETAVLGSKSMMTQKAEVELNI